MLVPQEEVQRVAAIARPLLEKLVPWWGGKMEVEDVFQRAAEGHMQLWLAWDKRSGDVGGLQLTELTRYPKRLVCRLIGTAGTGMLGANVASLLRRIEEWALFQGCDSMLCEGREGWSRYLEGYEETGRVWEKELSHGR